LAPENTLAAFRRAIQCGADGIEFDLHLTKDGAAVVHHDYRISPDWARRNGRWIEGRGPAIRDMTLAEVQSYDVGRLAPGSAYGRRYPDYEPADGERIPTLGEVLDLVGASAPAGFQLWVELKLAPPDVEPTSDPAALTAQVVKELAASRLVPQVTLISFYWPALYLAQRLAPGLRTGFLSAEREWLDNVRAGLPGCSPWTAPLNVDDFGGSVPQTIKAAGGNAWSVYWQDLTQASLAEARALGLETGVWTIRQREELAPVLALGVDVITTDRPDWFLP
jgi:glycerophosphoryl diester phosphodiesterase